MRELECDSVILSIGYKPENSLFQELKFDEPEVYFRNFGVRIETGGTGGKAGVAYMSPKRVFMD